jgi:hypothetical protein
MFARAPPPPLAQLGRHLQVIFRAPDAKCPVPGWHSRNFLPVKIRMDITKPNWIETENIPPFPWFGRDPRTDRICRLLPVSKTLIANL